MRNLDKGICIADKIGYYLSEGFKKSKRSDITRNRAFEIYKDLRGEPLILNGCNPKSVAAGIFYLACVMEGDSWTQADTYRLFDTSDAVVRKFYRLIAKHLGIKITMCGVDYGYIENKR